VVAVTEQQPYEVVKGYDGFELRRYPSHLLAVTEVTGSFEGAGNRAFPLLAGYIGGRNRSRGKVAMTSPVVQEGGGQDGRYVVGFVMPSEYSEESLPEPADPRVRTRAVPTQLAAAVRYSGRWSRGSYERHLTRLVEAVKAGGLRVAGPARWARYDPPWTPWFMRRNEVVVPVEEAPEAA
jgi:hypothetical protein